MPLNFLTYYKKIPFDDFEVLEDVKSGEGILLVDLEQLLSEKLLQELLKVHIDILWAPFAAPTWRNQLIADELLVYFTQKLMHCDVHSSSAAV